jgi:hypothetical protein
VAIWQGLGARAQAPLADMSISHVNTDGRVSIGFVYIDDAKSLSRRCTSL